MQTKIEALERKYQTIIEQKNSQIQQLMQEVRQFKNRTKSFLNFIFRMTLNKKHLKLKWKDM
jgi:predicted PurR-regulated permease PerM